MLILKYLLMTNVFFKLYHLLNSTFTIYIIPYIRNHVYIVNILFNKWYNLKKTFVISKYFRISTVLLYKVNRNEAIVITMLKLLSAPQLYWFTIFYHFWMGKIPWANCFQHVQHTFIFKAEANQRKMMNFNRANSELNNSVDSMK